MPDYARIVNGAITQLGAPPPVQQLDDGNWVDLRQLDPGNLARAGWVAIVETPQPADTDTTTSTSSVTLVNGVPTRTWTTVPKPPAIVTADQRLDAARTALAQLDVINAPLSGQDVAEILLDVRTALEA